jgi:hypothetical protein
VTLPRFAASHVLRRIRQGASSSPVVVETSGGSFVAKLRGAGHGVQALVAELVVGALALTVGLPVPERALIDLVPEFTSDDKNDELADLLGRSVGLNVGFRWLDGARAPRPEDLARLDDDFVARVLWLDGLVQNLDRSRDNPNLLWWKGRPFLIDHGSALPFQYDWPRVTETSPREPYAYARHLFHDRTALLPGIDAELARRASRQALDAALLEVPDELLTDATHEPAERARAAYHAFLWKRLKEPRAFLA